jgi:hypothetical protein
MSVILLKSPMVSGAFSIFVPMKKLMLLAFTFPAFAQYEALVVAGVSAGLSAGEGLPQ